MTAVDVHTVLVLTAELSNNNAAEGLALLTTALLVATLALRGNTWRPVLWSEVQEVAKAAIEAGEAATGEDSAARFMSTICRNPFLRPHFPGLLAGGFATRDEATDTIALTPEGIAALAKWVKMPAAEPAPAPAAP